MKGWRKFFYLADKAFDIFIILAARLINFIYGVLGFFLVLGLLINFSSWVIRPTGLRSDFPRLIAKISDLAIRFIEKITDLFHQFIQSIAGIPDTLRQLSLETFTQFISRWLIQSGFAPSTHGFLIGMAGLTILFFIVLFFWPPRRRRTHHPHPPRWLRAAWARTGGQAILHIRSHEKSLYRRNLLR